MIPPAAPAAKVPPGFFQRGLNAIGHGAGIAADESLTALNNLGAVTRHGARKAVNAGREFVDGFRGKRDVKRPTANEPKRLPFGDPNRHVDFTLPKKPIPQRPVPRTWGNIGTGAGVGLGATAGLTAVNPFRGGAPDDTLQDQQMQPAMGQSGGGLMDMWNQLPIEARYAIGAGVPAALLGAYMHGSGGGNSGLGAGIGALGLGAAGLGAAHAGMFGQGPQQFVRDGASALFGQNNPNMLVGSDDPNMQFVQGANPYQQQHSQAMSRMMPQLANSSTSSGSVKASAAFTAGVKFAHIAGRMA